MVDKWKDKLFLNGVFIPDQLNKSFFFTIHIIEMSHTAPLSLTGRLKLDQTATVMISVHLYWFLSTGAIMVTDI